MLDGASRSSLSERRHPGSKALSGKMMLHIVNFTGKGVIPSYLPYYQYGYAGMLTEGQREELWKAVDKKVNAISQEHFGRFQQGEYYEYHQERILAFYELAQARWDMSPAWVISAFRKGFSEIEALLQVRRLGISLDSDSILEYKRAYIKHFVQFFSWMREHEKNPHLSWDRWYYNHHGNYPSAKAKKLWWKRAEQLVLCINRCPHIHVFGFHYGKSDSDLLSDESEMQSEQAH